MYKMIFLPSLFTLTLYAADVDISLLHTGIETDHTHHNGEIERITVKRSIASECKKIHISNEVFWKEKYASHKVSKACKSTFITSAGKKIFPMKLHKEVETYGELEVMGFIKKMQHDPSMLFIDTRDEEWYGYRTIPGAENIHYLYITMPKVFEEEYKASIKKLGIVQKDNRFDFSHAKTLLLF